MTAMPFLALQPASNKRARESELKTLRISKQIGEIAPYTGFGDDHATVYMYPPR